MAGEVSVAREGVVSSINGEKSGGRNVPRLYSQADTEKYPSGQSLGISTRDASAEKDKTILESVLGQMSDGIWENSRQMEKYWRGMTFSQDEKGNVEMRHAYSYNDPIDRWVRGQVLRIPNYKYSGYNGMSEKQVREFFAKKIKQIYNQERKYYSLGKWSADNRSEMRFMHDGVSVADAYSLYKRLMGK